MIEVHRVLHSTWQFSILVVSYLPYSWAHTSYSDHFRLLHRSCIIQCWLKFSCFMWYAMTHQCPPTILQYIPCCHFWILLHRMWHPQKGCLRHLPYLYFSPNNQLPCVPSFFSCVILRWIRVLLYSFFLFTHQPDALCPYLPQFFHLPLKKLLLFFFVYPWFSSRTFSLGYFCPAYCFWVTLFSITNRFLSWGPCMPYLRYWHCNILSHVCILMVGHQIHVPFLSSSYFSYYSLILLNFIFKLYSPLNHISRSWLVSFILNLFHLFLTSFNFCVVIPTLHICQWVPSNFHIHYHCTASLAQTLCSLL